MRSNSTRRYSHTLAGLNTPRLGSYALRVAALGAAAGFFLWATGLWAIGLTRAARPAAAAVNSANTTDLAQSREQLSQLPLSFEANQGQTDPAVQFSARVPGYQLFLTHTEAVMVLRKPASQASRVTMSGDQRQAWRTRQFGPAEGPEEIVRMRLAGANAAPKVKGLEVLPGKTNYYRGADPARWQTGVPNYARVQYERVYPGIDLVYYGNQRQLEFDFVVAPGADPRQIKLDFTGVETMRLEADGDLVLKTPGGELRQRAPALYQEADGQRQTVKGRYLLTGARQVGFAVEGYDRSRKLVIDPVLVYATYLGGLGEDYLQDMAVNTAREVYVTGYTGSPNYPAPTAGLLGGVSKTTNGGGLWAAKNTGLPSTALRYVKVDPANTNTVYAVDQSTIHKSLNGGDTWSVSETGLPPFSFKSALIITPGVSNTLFIGIADGMAVYKSTDSGANWAASASGIPNGAFVYDFAIDAQTPAVIYAATDMGVYKSTNGGMSWAASNMGLTATFIYRIEAVPNAPGISTLYVSTNNGVFRSTDSAASWGLTGLTQPVGVIKAANALTAYANTISGLVKTIDGGVNWNPASTGLSCSGGFVSALALDPMTPSTLYAGTNGCGVFKTTDGGMNWSPASGQPGGVNVNDLSVSPTSPNTVYAALLRQVDVFVTKLNAAGNAIVYSTVFGSEGSDIANAIKVDNSGNAYVVGYAQQGFPTTPGAYQPTLGSGFDSGFFTRLDAAGTLSYSTFLTGTAQANDLVLDATSRAYIVGITSSTTMPTTTGAYQTANGGGFDIFAMRLNPAGGGLTDLQYASYVGGSGDDYVARVLLFGTGIIFAGQTDSADYDLRASAPLPFDATFSGGTCGISPFTYPCHDAVLTRLNMGTGGVADLSYSTYLGGSGHDFAADLVSVTGGATLVVGGTISADFPTTAGAYQTVAGGGTCNGEPCFDGFATVINTFTSGAAGMTYSTRLGGNGNDAITRVSNDSTGYHYFAGQTESANFPLVNPLDSTLVGFEAFVARFTTSLTGADALRFSTFFGGSGMDFSSAVRLDASGNVYLAGNTTSANFPTLNPLQAANAGQIDGFILKFTPDACPPITLSPATLPNGAVGSPYSQTFTAVGGATPHRFGFSNSGAPPGLTLTTAGLLSGTPTVSGTYYLTIVVADANGCATLRNYTLSIGLTLNPPVLPTGIINTAYSQTLTATGGTGPYTFTFTGVLPAGVSLTMAGLLSGTPTVSGTFTFTVTATDAASATGTRTYALAIYPAAASALVVTTTVDENNTNPAACSWREALLSANTNTAVGGCGTGLPGPDRIIFNLGAGPYSITTGIAAFPTINEPVWIDGSTGNMAAPRVELGGTLGTGLNFGAAAGNSITRNLVVNRFNPGINLAANSNNHVIEGCYVGTNAAGTAALANNTGIAVGSSYNRIGGTTPAQRNVISGNTINGLNLTGATVVGNLIQGNYIGVDATGNAALGNGNTGVGLGGRFNVLGGSVTGARNVISGNALLGLSLFGSQNVVQGNYIGTNAAGTLALGNGSVGILVNAANLDTQIGGTAAGEGNLIAFNGSGALLGGIFVFATPFSYGQNNAVLGNTIHSNFGPGLDLSVGASPGDGVTANDAGDGDVGPNLWQNYPVLTAATTGVVTGTLNSRPNQTYRLEFFGNTACDSSGYGEGEVLLGALNVTTNAVGDASFTTPVLPITPGQAYVTATATDAQGNTSEFSACVLATFCPPAITLSSLPDGMAGVAYNQTIDVTPASSYTFAVISGALPAGWSLNAATGVISGTTGTPGPVNFTITAANGSCSGSRNYALTVGCPPISLSALPVALAGTAYHQTISATPAGGNYSFALTGGLPPGLNFTNGVLSGTPTQAGNFSFTITATGFGTCAQARTYSFTVNCPTVTVSPATLPNGVVGSAYSPQPLSATPPGTTYSYAVTQGQLPPGLSLNSATGALSGTPAAAGNYSFGVAATGFGNCAGGRAYSLLVTGTCATIVLQPVNLPGGTVGAAYQQTISATGNLGPFTFSVPNGALPAGLTLNANSGVLSGTPTQGGTATFTIKATGASGCTGQRAYVLNIACGILSWTPATLPAGVQQQAYSQQLSLNAAGNVTFSLLLGSLPPGFTLSSSGLLSGFSNNAGTFNFTVKAVTGSCQSTKSYALVLNNQPAVRSDFDGDGKSDPYHWSETDGRWLISGSRDGVVQNFIFGAPGDLSTPGDYDGDGQWDAAVFRPANGTWYVRFSSNGQYLAKTWGAALDTPVPGDYDGDGQTDFAVWRGSEGRWYVWRSSDSAYQVEAWGAAAAPYSDVPVTGDYDGDGKSDLAVFRRGNGMWLIKHSSNGATQVQAWGLGTDTPVAADYDGDGRTDIAVWRGQEGVWYILGSADNAISTKTWGSQLAPYFDSAMPDDYDGDGKTDVAVCRHGMTWYIVKSSDGAMVTKQLQ